MTKKYPDKAKLSHELEQCYLMIDKGYHRLEKVRVSVAPFESSPFTVDANTNIWHDVAALEELSTKIHTITHKLMEHWR